MRISIICKDEKKKKNIEQTTVKKCLLCGKGEKENLTFQ